MKTQKGRDLVLAKKLLDKSELVAVPTETVYGLAGNALSEKAVQEIFRVKKRPLANPFILHLASKTEIGKYCCSIPELAYKLFDYFSPGPLTILLEKKSTISDMVTSDSKFVAVRIPNQKTTLSLLDSLDYPLCVSSANRYQQPSPTNSKQVLKNFENDIPYILEGGDCELGLESTIVKIVSENTIKILRQGSLTKEKIQEKLNLNILTEDNLNPLTREIN